MEKWGVTPTPYINRAMSLPTELSSNELIYTFLSHEQDNY